MRGRRHASLPTSTTSMPSADDRAAVAAKQRCLDQFSSGLWTSNEKWQPSVSTGCNWKEYGTTDARAALRNQHIMVVGDLHARLFWSAMVFLVNGTVSPEEVAPGIMRHRWDEGSACAWKPEKQSGKWYDWAGWGEFAKKHPCHITAYGWPNLYNVTLAKTSGWWGKGEPRDVMTMLLKESPRYNSFVHETTTISYVWRSVIRTSGSYARQHVRVMDKVASLIGRGPPTIVVSGMYAFDSQWQQASEVGRRMRGLYSGWNEHFGQLLKFVVGPSSCQPGRPYSTYMGKGSHHNIFHNMPNATALRPEARDAAENQSVLFLDTLPSKAAFTPTRRTPCHYDLPFGAMSEAYVQMVLNALNSGL